MPTWRPVSVHPCSEKKKPNLIVRNSENEKSIEREYSEKKKLHFQDSIDMLMAAADVFVQTHVFS